MERAKYVEIGFASTEHLATNEEIPKKWATNKMNPIIATG